LEDRIKIEIANRQDAHKINRPLLRRVLSHTMRGAGLSGTLSLAVVDEARMAELNRRYLGRLEPTDVLSFPLQDETSGPLGEIVVCADTAAKESARRRRSFDAELALYAVHGLLHLAGYDDTTEEQRTRMRRREREILSKFGLSAP